MKNERQNSHKILIVDDEENIRDYIETVLQCAHYQTEQAGDGVEALEKIHTFKPDIVVLDYMMPRMTGLEVLRQLASLKLMIPCIIVTGRGSEEIAVTMLKEGAFDYITKPFYEEELLNTVANAIDFAGDLETDGQIISELHYLKKENKFLKDQVNFMRKVLKMNQEGDTVLDRLGREILDIDITKFENDPDLLRETLRKLREEAKLNEEEITD